MIPVYVVSETPTYGASSRPAAISRTSTLAAARNVRAAPSGHERGRSPGWWPSRDGNRGGGTASACDARQRSGTLVGPWQASDSAEPSSPPSSSVWSRWACSPAASPSLSAGVPSAVASAAGIVLDRTESVGCDTIGIDYKSATIKIDAASDPDVWAETETGKKLAVKWTAGFLPVDAGAPADPWTEGRRGRPRRNGDRRPRGRQLSQVGRVLRVPGD